MIEFDKNFVIPKTEIKNSSFVNPLGNDDHPDPCIVYCERDKCYYGISTAGEPGCGANQLMLHKAERFEDMFVTSERKIIYTSNENDDTYGSLWAPEFHYIRGKWYLYTSCENSPEDHKKHIIVLGAITDSPFDGFKLCSHINRDFYAIDPTIYYDTENDRIYLCTSPVIEGVQMLAIQELKSPGEPVGKIEIIAKPELSWELVPPYTGKRAIVEGAYFVKSPEGRLFILYSANGCWSDDYVIGALEYQGGDLVSADAWEKHLYPVVTKGNGNFGPGHATFFYSPDKSELWICHHCLLESNPSVKYMKRRCHCQRVFFDKTGFPHIGELIPCGMSYAVPSYNI